MFGCARDTSDKRAQLNRGRKRKLQDSSTTEAAFLKRRRAAANLKTAAQLEDSVHIGDIDVSAGCVVNVSYSILPMPLGGQAPSQSLTVSDSVCQIVNQ